MICSGVNDRPSIAIGMPSAKLIVISSAPRSAAGSLVYP